MSRSWVLCRRRLATSAGPGVCVHRILVFGTRGCAPCGTQNHGRGASLRPAADGGVGMTLKRAILGLGLACLAVCRRPQPPPTGRAAPTTPTAACTCPPRGRCPRPSNGISARILGLGSARASRSAKTGCFWIDGGTALADRASAPFGMNSAWFNGRLRHFFHRWCRCWYVPDAPLERRTSRSMRAPRLMRMRMVISLGFCACEPSVPDPANLTTERFRENRGAEYGDASQSLLGSIATRLRRDALHRRRRRLCRPQHRPRHTTTEDLKMAAAPSRGKHLHRPGQSASSRPSRCGHGRPRIFRHSRHSHRHQLPLHVDRRCRCVDANLKRLRHLQQPPYHRRQLRSPNSGRPALERLVRPEAQSRDSQVAAGRVLRGAPCFIVWLPRASSAKCLRCSPGHHTCRGHRLATLQV